MATPNTTAAPSTEKRLTAVEMAIVRIDTILPTLATKEDLAVLRSDIKVELANLKTTFTAALYQAIDRQSWRLFLFVTGYVTLAGGALAGGVYYIVRHSTP